MTSIPLLDIFYRMNSIKVQQNFIEGLSASIIQFLLKIAWNKY